MTPIGHLLLRSHRSCLGFFFGQTSSNSKSWRFAKIGGSANSPLTLPSFTNRKKAPENRPGPTRRFHLNQPSIFRGVSAWLFLPGFNCIPRGFSKQKASRRTKSLPIKSFFWIVQTTRNKKLCQKTHPQKQKQKNVLFSRCSKGKPGNKSPRKHFRHPNFLRHLSCA